MLQQKPLDQYVEAGNVRTRFWAVGDKGSVVILLHPGLGSVENWSQNIFALAKNHRVYAIDMLGFGHTGLPNPPFSLNKAAQHVNDFIETQGIERVNVVGHCGGGVVSLYFAFQFPDKLEKLVLVSSWGLGSDEPLITRLGTLPIVGDLLMRPMRKSTEMIWKMGVYDQRIISDELVSTFYKLMRLPGAQKAYMSVFRSIGNFNGSRPDILQYVRDNLNRITAPTLIVWGKQDRLRPVAHAEVAKERIPNSRLHVFDPCGHLPPIEYPEEFNNLLLEFLSS
jgi:4,5:9,10-diseco-3-hydroxy-5,9,17-trioxoandrosta-1(10),2-diene-4-oate hydrolase